MRLIITLLDVAVLAGLMHMANPPMFPNLVGGTVLTVVLGLALYCADGCYIRYQTELEQKPFIIEFTIWALVYLLIPVGIYCVLVFTGLAMMPYALMNAFGLCLLAIVLGAKVFRGWY
ncbi:MAG: hypothetical protein K2X93_14560 [Candidatus Obscuribacterales bacterium]|nr:hypothetical protein [Candidatus Obscuribacterales bacterium]